MQPNFGLDLSVPQSGVTISVTFFVTISSQTLLTQPTGCKPS